MDPGPWIPIFGIAVGAIAVIGKVIIQPIVHAVTRMNEQKAARPAADVARLEARIAELEERLAGTERSIGSLEEDRDFYRQLASGDRPAP